MKIIQVMEETPSSCTQGGPGGILGISLHGKDGGGGVPIPGGIGSPVDVALGVSSESFSNNPKGSLGASSSFVQNNPDFFLKPLFPGSTAPGSQGTFSREKRKVCCDLVAEGDRMPGNPH